MGRIYIKCIRWGRVGGSYTVRMCIGNFSLVLRPSASSLQWACVVARGAFAKYAGRCSVQRKQVTCSNPRVRFLRTTIPKVQSVTPTPASPLKLGFSQVSWLRRNLEFPRKASFTRREPCSQTWAATAHVWGRCETLGGVVHSVCTNPGSLSTTPAVLGRCCLQDQDWVGLSPILLEPGSPQHPVCDPYQPCQN